MAVAAAQLTLIGSAAAQGPPPAPQPPSRRSLVSQAKTQFAIRFEIA